MEQCTATTCDRPFITHEISHKDATTNSQSQNPSAIQCNPGYQKVEPYSSGTRSSHLTAWTQLLSDRICYVCGLQLWLPQTIMWFCLLGRMSPRVYWSHSFLFYYLRDAVSGILDCAVIADGFQIAEGLWNHWPVAPPLHRFTLHCIMVYGGPISFSIALKLLWYGHVSSLLQSVWAWCVGAILWIPLQSYRLLCNHM